MNLAHQNRQSQLNLYRAAGVGGLALAGMATSADASIVFVNFNNTVIVDTNTADTTFAFQAFDFDGNGTLDFRFAQRITATGSAALLTIPAAGLTLDVIGLNSSGYNYPARLAAGANIGPSAAFITLAGTGFAAQGSLANGTTGFPNSAWQNDSTPGFLGIRFTIGGTPVYGWLQISVAAATAGQPRAITLISGAFETNGTAITAGAGAIPEPTTTVGLLALGATGLLAHRRAKRRQAA